LIKNPIYQQHRCEKNSTPEELKSLQKDLSLGDFAKLIEYGKIFKLKSVDCGLMAEENNLPSFDFVRVQRQIICESGKERTILQLFDQSERLILED
jgi:hypothetical protein